MKLFDKIGIEFGKYLVIISLSVFDKVEIILHARREIVINDLREAVLHELRRYSAKLGRLKRLAVSLDISAVDDGRDRGGVC